MTMIIEQFRKELCDLALYADDTVANYIACLYKFMAFLETEFNIELLNTKPEHLKQWLAHLKKANLSNSRLNHHRSALQGFFTFLVKMELMDHNPAEGLFLLRRTNSELNQPIDPEIALQLLKAVDRADWIGERNFMIISCLYALGLRRQELANLKIRDFDPNYDPTNRIGLLIIHGKGRKQRALFVVDKLYDKLVTYLNHPVAPTHVKLKCNLKNRPIFPSKNGAILTGDHILKIVHQAAQQAGIKQRITPHVLRHSFATEMYLAKTPLNDIQDILGHETEAETALYIHVPEKLKQQALKSITIEAAFSWPYRYGGTSRLAC